MQITCQEPQRAHQTFVGYACWRIYKEVVNCFTIETAPKTVKPCNFTNEPKITNKQTQRGDDLPC